MNKLLKYDIVLQLRQGFWLVYSIVTLVYLAVLLNIPENSRFLVSILLIFSDTSILGIVFIGALILLEKQQNILQSLFVSPLPISWYLVSKVLSLSLLALVMSSVIFLVANGFTWHFARVAIAVFASSWIFTFIGLGVSARVETINQYLFGFLAASLLIAVPVIPFLIMENTGWLIIFPPNAALGLMLGSAHAPRGPHVWLALLILVAWGTGAYLYASREFRKYLSGK